MKTKIAFLYSEVAGYFMACVKRLSEDADVLVVRWEVNKEAPFEFGQVGNADVREKTAFPGEKLDQFIVDFNPDIVICSGWMDKDYMRIMKTLPKSTKRVLSLDNHWTGGVKQRLASVLAPFWFKGRFTHAWVPGKPQFTFARKLGFKESDILKGFYCADTDLFEQKFQKTFPQKKEVFPKRFLYVARYVRHKGIFEMWEAFRQLQEEMPNEWELYCLGTGEEWENRVEHPKVKHIGFVQPTEMDEYIQSTGVYILPSTFEPWGVSSHEFAIAGFPLLLSDAIGSADRFLESGRNGYEFPAGDILALKNAMRKIIELTDEERVEMGEKSHEIGMSYTINDWCKTIKKLN